MIVDRRELRDELARLLALLTRAARADVLTHRASSESAGRRSRPVDSRGWLAYLETLHPKVDRDGARSRARRVRDACASASTARSITVTGTNGKGSTCAMLDAMLRCAGYRVGLYTSPHLLRYNERVRIDGAAVDDEALIEAFNAVEDARVAARSADAAHVFRVRHAGRVVAVRSRALDALDPRGGPRGTARRGQRRRRRRRRAHVGRLDHIDYLGDDARGRSAARRPASFAPDVRRSAPSPIRRAASSSTPRAIGATLLRAGRDYGAVREGRAMALLRVRAGNASACRILRCAAPISSTMQRRRSLRSRACATRLPVARSAIREGADACRAAGTLHGAAGTADDRARRRAQSACGARARACLGAMGFHPQTHAVCGMLADKDVDGVIAALRARIDRWYVASLPGPRGARADAAARPCWSRPASTTRRSHHRRRRTRLRSRAAAAGEADRIVVFGSFLTVAAALARGRPADSSDASPLTHARHDRAATG